MTQIVLGTGWALPQKKHAAFFNDVVAGMSDVMLAAKFGLRERTATNYRLRAESLAQEMGIAIAERTKKGHSASDGCPCGGSPEITGQPHQQSTPGGAA